MKEISTKFHSYKTLDRIENLKIHIKVYRKSEQLILVDGITAGWQESIKKGELRQVSDESINSTDGKLRRKPSKKNRKTTDKKRSLFTRTDADYDVENLAKDMNQIGFIQNKANNIKTSQGLVRALEPLSASNPNHVNLDSFGSALFAPKDEDALGVPSPSAESSRWNSVSNASTYSEMQFLVSLPTATASKSDVTSITSAQDDESSPQLEKCLCKIQYFGNGNFSITPNFTTDLKMHEFQLGDEMYIYSIQNASHTLSPENEFKEQLIFEEFFKKQLQVRMEKLSGEVFQEIPTDYQQRLCVNGEIESCSGFHSDSLYCQFLISVPSEWKSDHQQLNLLSATTQISYSTILEGHVDYTAFFGFPIELNLISAEKTPRYPKLFVKVFSVDSQERHCVEGYGNVNIPLEAGSYEFELKTWRPLFHFQERLKTFLLGGSPDLVDFTYNDLEEVLFFSY